MRSKLLAAGGFALLVAPLLALGQPPAARSLSGYVIIRVNLDDGAASAPSGGDGGGLTPGGDGPGSPDGPGQGLGGRGGRGDPRGGIGAGGAQPGTDPNKSVVVVVPFTRMDRQQRVYSKFPASQQNPPLFNKLVGPMGTAYLYTDSSKVSLDFSLVNRYLPTMLEKRHIDWTREKPLDGGKALVDDALAAGLADKAFQYAAEVADIASKRKDAPKPAVAAFLKAFASFKDTLNKPLPANPEVSQWQSRLGAQGLTESEHYSVIHFGEGSLPKDAVDRRVKALENNFRAFYLWYAVGGEAVPLPPQKLVVVIADKASDMPKLQAALDGNQMTVSISDAFYSPAHNLVVMSPERRDPIGQTWSNYVQQYYQRGYSRDELLRGIPPQPKPNETALDAALVMTMALVDRQFDEEAVTAMVTREGSRQLFASANKLNPHVILPEWVEQGVSNLLNKPKGPYFHTVNGRPRMTLGVMSGYGAPNYMLVREFVKMQQGGEFNPKPEEMLMNVLTDRYFDAWRDGVDIDPPPPPSNGGGQALGGSGPGPLGGGATPNQDGGRGGQQGRPGGRGGLPGGGDGSADPSGGAGGMVQQQQGDPQADARKLKAKLQVKSQATAWGLTHFLAKRRSAALFKFFDDLNRMPRDMRLDRQQVVMMFCRDFDLMDSRDPSKIDMEEFKKLAVEWLNFMRPYSNEGVELDAGPPAGGSSGPGGFPGGAGGLPGGAGGVGGPGGSPDGG